MSQMFSTQPLPACSRIDAWQWKAKEICGDCHFDFPKHYPFHGSIEVRLVCGLELMRFSSSPLSFTESVSEPANSMAYVITQIEGFRSYSQDGTRVVLEPGDSTLIDSGRPWSSHCPEESVRLYLRVPRRLLENRLKITTLPVARRIPGNAGLGATFFRIGTSLFDEANIFNPEDGTSALEAYFNILSACLAHSSVGLKAGQSFHELTTRIHSFVEAHLAEPDLGPEKIALAFGISVRHLHRLFSTEGHTVADWIRDRRLERCNKDLMNSCLCEKTITEIAFFW